VQAAVVRALQDVAIGRGGAHGADLFAPGRARARARPFHQARRDGAQIGDEVQVALHRLADLGAIDLDVKICVINNGYLGMVRQWQEFFYQRRYAATPITGPDFEKLAGAYGVWGATVTSRAQVEPTVATARRQKGALVDFRVEQEDSVFPMVPAGNDLHNMIRRPSPIVETSAD